VTPYWTSPDGAVVVYCARWEDVVAAGCVPVREVALVHADPPYGQNERTEREKAGRGGRGGLRAPHPSRDWIRVEGDDRPFDPGPLLAFNRPLVTWGAQRYAERLPPSPSWFWWDKREETTPDDNGDGEMAWTNLSGPPRQFSHLWRGLCRASEKGGGGKHLHPTQKPIALCSWVYARAKLRAGNLVFVPYMGSGPDLPACVAAGLRCIACEVVEDYCRVAVARLGAVTAEAAAQPAGPLFAGRQP
jgi:site-specific DNA-methyltransferase (adenine-specific)/modification methylase